MQRNWTTAIVLMLTVFVGLLMLTACPKKTVERPGEVVQPPAAPRETAEPPAELLPPAAEEEAAAEETPEEPAEEPAEEAPEAPAAMSIDGFKSLIFGMTAASAMANLPFGLSMEDAGEQADFALEGDVAYLFKVPYSEYPLLQPKEEFKGGNFGITVIFWDGKFECLSVIISPEHIDPAGWSTTVDRLAKEYGEPVGVTVEEGEAVTMWMDAKGRAVAVTQPVMPQPDSFYRIDFQSDAWLALFAE